MTSLSRLDSTKGKVCIVGSGAIGRNWAVLFARSGFLVTLYDVNADQLIAAQTDIVSGKLGALARFDMLGGLTQSEVQANIVHYTTDLATAVANAAWIQVGVPEAVAVKRAVLSQVSVAVKASQPLSLPIIASSSSTIKPSQLIRDMVPALKGRFLVAHPVNPPYAIPVVELVPSPQTTDAVMDIAASVMTSIGMRPIRMRKEVDGFVVNRLQYSLMNAAYQLVRDGVASAKDVDAAVKDGLGLRWSFMGPFETIHLNAPNGLNDYYV